MDDLKDYSLGDPLNEDQLGLFENADDADNAENPHNWLDGEEKEPSSSGRVIEAKPKRAVRNPRLRLTADTLRGPRGIQTIQHFFKDIKFKGKEHEKHDLNEVLSRIQHWAHRMYPTNKFEDVLTTVENLGKKKMVQMHMNRYRLGQLEDDEARANAELLNYDKETEIVNEPVLDEPFDELDALLGEQIAISMLATPHQTLKHGPANTTGAAQSPRDGF